MEYAQTIITGVDNDGAHIYRLIGNQHSCYDMLGFCAVGSGGPHAESQFMLCGYSRMFKQEDALWVTYLAKRKSEIAPGVGKDTVLFSINPKDKTINILNNYLDLNELEKHYKRFNDEQEVSFHRAAIGFRDYLKTVKKEEA
jgi:hypothetical protein